MPFSNSASVLMMRVELQFAHDACSWWFSTNISSPQTGHPYSGFIIFLPFIRGKFCECGFHACLLNGHQSGCRSVLPMSRPCSFVKARISPCLAAISGSLDSGPKLCASGCIQVYCFHEWKWPNIAPVHLWCSHGAHCRSVRAGILNVLGITPFRNGTGWNCTSFGFCADRVTAVA